VRSQMVMHLPKALQYTEREFYASLGSRVAHVYI
jgi:hypothetical protein